MDLDAECLAALHRLQVLTDARIAAFRQQAAKDAEHVRRSFGQRWRFLKQQVMEGFR